MFTCLLLLGVADEEKQQLRSLRWRGRAIIYNTGSNVVIPYAKVFKFLMEIF